MTNNGFAVLLGAVLALGIAARAHAQNLPPYEVSVHVGGVALDDFLGGETEFAVGSRVLYSMSSGLGVGTNFDWIQPTPKDDFGEDVNINIYLYSGEVDYTFRTDSQTMAFVGAGVGAATFSPEEGESATEVLIPLAAGVRWVNDAATPEWGIRAEFRDNVIVVSVDDEDLSDQTTNNIEFSVGITFYVGS